MHGLGELDLYHLRWEEASFAADPLPEFAKAREQHPWIAKSAAGYVVFEFQAIRDLLPQDDKLRPAFDGIVEFMGGQGTPWGRFMDEQIVALADEEHKIMRGALVAKFAPGPAKKLRPEMHQLMEGLLAEWLPKRRIDFEEFASYYPIGVVAQMIGAPLSAIPGLRHSLETLGDGFSLNPETLPQLNEAVLHIQNFSEQVIADRRANPRAADEPENLLDVMIRAIDEGRIAHDRIIFLLVFLFLAGYDTSKNVFTYMMWLMIRHPDIYQRCAEDYDYCEKVVEETLRVFSPGATFRYALEDIHYRGVVIPKGTMLFFTLNVSGRDPTAYQDVDDFDPDRTIAPDRRHMAFGMGHHVCLGQFVARVQLQEGIHMVAQHMRNPKLTGEPGWRPFPGMWGIQGLPIEFTPA